MRGVKNPIAISPYYTNQTTEGFEDPKYTGDRIPDSPSYPKVCKVFERGWLSPDFCMDSVDLMYARAG